jgi:transcriptional regulator with XRE-family HTH domain
MITRLSSSRHAKRRNAQRRVAPREALSARLFRFRIARGCSIYELATAARVFAPTIERLEAGEPADKRVLSALATALGVPLCQLVCGDHSCRERACVRAFSVSPR